MDSQVDQREMRQGLFKAVLQGALVGLLIAVGFAGGVLFNMHYMRPPASDTSYALLQEAEGMMAEYFLYDPPTEVERVHGAAAGLILSYEDPYTFFVEPQTAEVDTGNLAGRFGGIGAEITQTPDGSFVIVTVYRDNPAFEAGMQAGDIIVAVDGMDVVEAGVDLNGLLSLVRGDVGEPLALTVRRGEETLDFEMIRAEVLIPSAFWRILEEDSRIGYVQLTRFTDRAPEEIRQAIDELEAQGAEALIFDLRNNGGGLVDSAVAITGEFLDGGVILYEERRVEGEQVFNAPRGGHALDTPLVVLVNQNTASASEIVGGALQDRDRAVLIGQHTYGKGSVQLILPLSDGSSIHVTAAQWFTPDRHPLEGEGLTPDVVIEPVEGVDVELPAAVDYLNGILEQGSTQ